VTVADGRRSRRRLLARITAAAAVVVVVAVAIGVRLYAGAVVDTVGDVDFTNRLRIPPVLEPTTDASGRKVFDLALQQGTSALVDGRRTATWGVNGPYLGPTLRARRGDDVLVRVRNDLPEATTLHWHGMHLPAAADGNPHQPIEPGSVWTPSWRIDQPAATLWYHPHPHGRTADHVYRGIAGLFLVDDPDAAPRGLPSRYGVDDFPLIVQDKRFDGDGALDAGAPTFSDVGQLGDEILVNGTHSPFLDVTADRVRLRVLNASNARVYDLHLDDDRAFAIVGTDGGLLPAAVEATHVQVSPGERVEIVVSLDAGEDVVLRSGAPDLGMGGPNDRFSGGDDRFDLLELRAAPDLTASPALPLDLAPDELPDPDGAVETRRFELSGSSRINGRRMDPARIDTVVAVDTTEIWEVANDSGRPHSFHVHDVRFRVLTIDGRPPPPHLRGPKDTVFVAPRSTVRIALAFGDHADADTPYMYHCHFLAHEDDGMMAQFTVVDGEDLDDAPRAVDPSHDHDDDGEARRRIDAVRPTSTARGA
jgi:blue copper oxidase